ncbi:MAG: DUF2812 domain-containing protein [Tissierellia bacterium]|nr:DUF2812 domain-containing protein [Tissierellia bacterium]
MNKTIRLHLFSYYDNSKFENYLEKMAMKGWMLENIYGYIHIYKRIEPKKLKFAVKYLYQGSVYFNNDEEAVLEYREIMEEAGWNHLTDCAEIQVFYSENEDHVPIDTEPEVEYRSILKTFKKTSLPMTLYGIFYSFFIIASRISYMKYFPLEHFSSKYYTLYIGFYLLIITFCLFEIIAFGLWASMAKNKLDRGGGLLSLGPMKGLEYSIAIIISIALLYIVFFVEDLSSKILFLSIALFMVVLGVLFEIMRRKKTMEDSQSKKVVFFFSAVLLLLLFTSVISKTFAPEEKVADRVEIIGSYEYKIYEDNIPLKIEDYRELGGVTYSYELFEAESPIVKRITGRQDAFGVYGEDLVYTIGKIKWDFMYDYILNKELKFNSMGEGDLEGNPAYGDMKVYKNHLQTFTISNGNYIITIKFPFEVKPEELVKAVDILVRAIESR